MSNAARAARGAVPRGLIAGTLVALAITWALFLLAPGGGPTLPIVQTAVYLTLFVITVCSRRAKILLARTFQRWLLSPAVRTLLAVGLNPLGLALLETTGRTSGRPRRVPVGNGRTGDDFWIIAEHGLRAGYVRNIRADPRVRVRVRIGFRYRWLTGVATVLPDDDPLARQRRIIRGHPLRAFNAMNVRVLGADLVTVRIRLTDRNEQLQVALQQGEVAGRQPV
ncbi:nitroreductase/quinone reductase family protein [Nakamurella lactea]|uniref:nitroreductase/quinone reductase family protein n=1 Tax=Nakamurella lactea TaxID=459515 RepID=UPI0012B50DBF|nr:nitroreductase/quinone reductase family protein [Nakamurella lactea]